MPNNVQHVKRNKKTTICIIPQFIVVGKLKFKMTTEAHLDMMNRFVDITDLLRKPADVV